jgi:hypothetical protein
MTYPGFLEGRFTIPSGVTLTATTNAGGPTAVPITAGSYYASTFAAQLQTDLIAARSVTAGTWSVTFSATTGLFAIAVTNGAYSITWTTAALGTLLGFSTITTQTSVTGSAPAGVFLPDCPIALDGDLDYAPLLTDHRGTTGPTGVTFAVVGNTHYRYRNVRWSHVARSKVWGSSGTWEQFLKDVHLGQGHAYFVPSSKIRVYYNATSKLGGTTGTFGWYIAGIGSIEPPKVSEQWGGLWRLVIPELVSDGT